jgi:hypothetical protein
VCTLTLFVIAPFERRFIDQTKFDHDISVGSVDPCALLIHVKDNESHFYLALQQWRQLNLSLAFVQFSNKVSPPLDLYASTLA